jgi:katanin p60 ATPase-containing subunit A1
VARKKLFEISFNSVKLDPDIDWDLLARKTEGYSGSDIYIVSPKQLCRDAAMMPLRRKLVGLRKGGISAEAINLIKNEVDVPLTMTDLTQAVKNCNKSVGAENLEHYSTWMSEYGNV